MPNWLSLFTNLFVHLGLEARRVHLTPDMAESDLPRREFQVLHKRAEPSMKVSVVAAVVAMLLS